jgi:chromosome segregation protein
MSSRGAQFRKTDLQVHSPRDGGWDGARPEDHLSGEDTDADLQTVRRDYCKEFIGRCIEKGLTAVSITDHHEGVYVYEALQALAEMQEADPDLDFWIFPGMELTCKDSCQALIIFDVDLAQNLFEKARSKLSLPADVRPEEKLGIQVELLNHNLEELQSLLDGDDELQGRFIILPHVKPDGHKTVLRRGFHKRFKDMPYVGGYMDKARPDDLKPGDRRILDGEIPAWASEKRGVVSCSDARHADFRLIGNHATWIKLASPKAESLRQAMLAPDSRIRHSEPALPEALISELSVSGSKYLTDGTYLFNPQMNSIIGGRGAGKSTLIEYVRFALGCSAIDDDQDTQTTATQRLKEILEGTLDHESGEISLKVLLNGTPITLTRTVARQDVISVETEGSVSLSSVADVRMLVPTQQYRQGELSDLARGDAEERLLRLVTAPASHQLSEIETKLKRNAQSLTDALSKAVRLSASQHAQSHAQTKILLLKSQIENLEKQLSADGQVPATAITEDEKFTRQGEALASARRVLERSQETIGDSLSDLISKLNVATTGQPVFLKHETLSQVFHSLQTAILPGGSLQTILASTTAWFDSELGKISSAEKDWAPILEAHVREYEEQKKLLAGKEAVLENIERLRGQLSEAEEQFEAAEVEVNELRNADSELVALRHQRAELEVQLSAVVQNQIATIEEASSELANGRLAQDPNYSEIEEAIQQAFELPRLRGLRIERILKNVQNAPEKPAKWKEIQDEALQLLKWKEGAAEDKGDAPLTPILSEALGPEFMERLKEAISTERVSVLLRAILRPRVEVFHIRDGSPIEFRKASQGEQAATLLNILMNQAHGPLIIDQPEEDLDNMIINEIIKTIRAAKDNRQLILATHNANIAVNGDSENVIQMVLGRQAAGGAIDEELVCDAITNTMEGGRVAFELRRKKYNF